MMDLLLVRHGLAGKADPRAWPDDDERPLTEKGREAFRAAAKGMKSQGPKPALILASPAVRTRETAALLAKAMGLKQSAIRNWDAIHHSRAPEKALADLARQGLPKSAALVGHEPWLGEFLSLLIGTGRDPRRRIPGQGTRAPALAPDPGPAGRASLNGNPGPRIAIMGLC
jgi:phosphohistidine phosphatase